MFFFARLNAARNASSFLINWNQWFQFSSFQAAVFRRSRWSNLLLAALHSLWQLKAFCGPVAPQAAPPAAPKLKQDGALPRAQWRPGCGRPTQKFPLNFSESSLLVWCIVSRQRPNSTELHHGGQRRQPARHRNQTDSAARCWFDALEKQDHGT